ncbi:MAG: fibro-slime domain-containing protein [Verrucomicrobia bacterium]|nr:fibro-slime domain-containing protein [Verrucomicrobiota bacterium]
MNSGLVRSGNWQRLVFAILIALSVLSQTFDNLRAAGMHVLKNGGIIEAYETDGAVRPTVFTDDTVHSHYIAFANYKGEFLLLSNDGHIDDLHPELGYRENAFTHLSGFIGYKGIAFDPVAQVILLLNAGSKIEAYDSERNSVTTHPFHGVQLPPLSVRDITYDSINHHIIALHTDGKLVGYNSFGNIIPTEFSNTHNFVNLSSHSGIALIFDPFDLFKNGEWPYEVKPVNLLSSQAVGVSGKGAAGVPKFNAFHIPEGQNRALLVVAIFERDHYIPADAEDEDDEGDEFMLGGNFAAPGFRDGDYTINAQFTGPGGTLNQRNPLAFPEGDLRFTWQYIYQSGFDSQVDGVMFSGETYHIAIYETEIKSLLGGAKTGSISINLNDVPLPKNDGDDAVLMAYVFENVEQTTRGITRSGVANDTDLSGGKAGNWVRSDNDLDSLQEPDEPQDGFLAVGFSFLGYPQHKGGFLPTQGFETIHNLTTQNANGIYSAYNDPDGISIGAEYRNGPESGVIDSFTMASGGPEEIMTNGGGILGFTIEAIGAGSSEEDKPFDTTRIPIDTRTYLIQTDQADIYSIDLVTGESWLLVDNSFDGEVNGAGFNIIDGTIWGYLNSENLNNLVKYDGSFKPEIVPITGLNPGTYVTGDINSAGLLYLKSSSRVEIIDLNPFSPSYKTSIGEITLHPPLSNGFNFHDWAFSPMDGKLYTVNADSELLRINPFDGKVDLINTVNGMTDEESMGTNGAVFFDSNGNLYISDNSSGIIFKVLTPHLLAAGGPVEGILFTYGPKSGINDGVRAPTALLSGLPQPIDPEELPETISLPALIRDVHIDHPNFQNGISGLVKGVVKNSLGADGKPEWNADTIAKYHTSLSNQFDFNMWWNDTPGLSKSIQPEHILSGDAPGSKLVFHRNANGTFTFKDLNFFPLHVNSVVPGSTLEPHLDNNYHFTMEVHTYFTYTKGSVLEFTGDDDVWVYIDGKLAVDLGGVHAAQKYTLHLDDLNLREGRNYSFDLFFAERNTVDSQLVITVPAGFGFDVPEFPPMVAECCLGEVSMDQYSTNGAAEFFPATEAFLLASGYPGKNIGSVWKNQKIDLTQDFLLSADMYFGLVDSGQGGITMTLQDSLAGSQAIGGDVATFGTVPTSFGIYFKTYSEGLDPIEDHFGFYQNGIIAPIGQPALPINLNGANIENGQWLPVEIIWNAGDMTMSIHVDGFLVQTLTHDIINNALGGSQSAYIGFTAATGPNDPNKYGVRICELEVHEDSMPEFTLSVAETRDSDYLEEGVVLDPDLTVISDTPGALVPGAAVRFAGGFDSSKECLILMNAASSGSLDGVEWNYNNQTGVLALKGKLPSKYINLSCDEWPIAMSISPKHLPQPTNSY